MNHLESVFLIKFSDADFMRQQKARVLMYFVLVAAVLLTLILILTNLFVEAELISGRNLMRLSLLAVSMVSLFLIKSGKYNFAANFILAASTLSFGVQTVFDSFSSPSALTIRVLYLFIFIFIAAVFCTRAATILTAITLFLVFGALMYRNSAMLGSGMKSLIISFSSCLLFISTLAYLLLSIVQSTFNKIAENDEREKQHADLMRMIETVRDVSEKLTELADKFTVENRSLSEITVEQSASIEEIAASIEEISESIGKSSDNTEVVKNLASRSAINAADGVALVEKVINSISDIETSSKKIADITTMINEIAFTTNLLALNAAVEAARAGDAGRGFAIVAGEVRNLAQRASASSKEIDTLVKESIVNVKTGAEYVRQSGEFIKSISEVISGVSRGISDIAISTSEQREGIEQVNFAVMEIDSSTQQNSALVENNAAIGSEISDQVRILMDLLAESET